MHSVICVIAFIVTPYEMLILEFHLFDGYMWNNLYEVHNNLDDVL